MWWREQAGSLTTNGWYVIARDGDLVLRVRPGVQLGEDPAGELSFDSVDAQVRFDITDDEGLALIAQPDHELETASGHRTRRLDFSRESPVRISLTNNVLSVSTDFAGSRRAEAVQVRVIQSLIVMPEPVAETSHRFTAVRSSGRVGMFTTLAIGSTFALVLAYLMFQPHVQGLLDVVKNETNETTRAAVQEPQPATRPSDGEPDVAEIVDDITALLDTGPLPAESAVSIAVQSLKALLAAYPEDSRVREELETLTKRLANEAKLQHDAGDAALAKRLIDQASTTGVAQGHVAAASNYLTAPRVTATSATEALKIEPVFVPPIRHRKIPGGPSDSLAAAEPALEPAPEPAPEPADGADSTEFAVMNTNLEQIGRAVQAVAVDMANERDLRAAAEALERGLLMAPPETSAFALYSRVLESDPASQVARIGIQSVRGRLLAGARVALASDDVGAAMASLDDAAAAGVDPAILDVLRAEASYRQGLVDAKAGKAGSLYPITELVALRQDPPQYPRHAPAGAEASVDIEMTVTASGEVRDVEVLGDPPMYFLRAAKQGVGEWRFAPVLGTSGKPVPVRTSVKVTFSP